MGSSFVRRDSREKRERLTFHSPTKPPTWRSPHRSSSVSAASLEMEEPAEVEGSGRSGLIRVGELVKEGGTAAEVVAVEVGIPWRKGCWIRNL